MSQRIPTLIEHPTRDGRIIALNKKRLAAIPYFLLTNPPNNEVSIAANQASPMQIMEVSGEGPAQVVGLKHEKTGDLLVLMQIQDGRTQRGLMNGAVHIDTIMGDNFNPYILPEGLYLDERRSIQVTFTDISGAANTVRVVAETGRFLEQQVDPQMARIRYRMSHQQYLTMPYFYTFDQQAPTLAVAEERELSITVGQTHHFEIITLSGVQTGPYDIDIIDAEKGQSIITAPQGQNYRVRNGLIIGTGTFPFKLHSPRLIQVGQRLIVRLRNQHTAPNTVHLTLGGRAIALKLWR